MSNDAFFLIKSFRTHGNLKHWFDSSYFTTDKEKVNRLGYLIRELGTACKYFVSHYYDYDVETVFDSDGPSYKNVSTYVQAFRNLIKILKEENIKELSQDLEFAENRVFPALSGF